ncbi:MAG: hypothetical protein GW762_04095 [Candidatus Pacebacteria bacterium]|nr:hypothetical protein [Candidatus Paceibacterota bacterium]
MINPLLTEPFESEILELIETSDEFTTSDLQGVVTVLVNKIMIKGHEILKESE